MMGKLPLLTMKLVKIYQFNDDGTSEDTSSMVRYLVRYDVSIQGKYFFSFITKKLQNLRNVQTQIFHNFITKLVIIAR